MPEPEEPWSVRLAKELGSIQTSRTIRKKAEPKSLSKARSKSKGTSKSKQGKENKGKNNKGKKSKTD